MTYQPLARKYRPAQFADLVGHESVALALANAIKLGREPHGILFSGIRGIGKTTLVRLYAKALNCEAGPTPTPCGACASCKSIAAGNHVDVAEIDGASHTGVDDIRDLKETLNYIPQRGKFRVVIIDEVHMLSQSAFNALLKTLEEPPTHVVFLFATTELQKVPATILSRCQVFHLKKIPLNIIRERIEWILNAEGIAFDPKAVAVVAREGRGSMRDALTRLDQVIALGEGKVTLGALESMVHFADGMLFLNLLEALIKKDAARVIGLLDQVEQSGMDFFEATELLTQWARHAVIVRDVGRDKIDPRFVSLEESDLDRLTQIGGLAQPFDLNRMIRSLTQCYGELENSALDRIVMENYLLEWCLDPGLPQEWVTQKPNAAPAPIASMAKPTSMATPKVSAPVATSTPLAPTPTAAVTAAPVNAPTSAAWPTSWKELVDAWKAKKPLQGRMFEEAELLEYSPARIVVAVRDQSLAGKTLLQKDQQAQIAQTLKDLFGFIGELRIQNRAGAAATETLLDAKRRDDELRKEAAIKAAQENPITQAILSQFGGKIESIQVKDPGQ